MNYEDVFPPQLVVGALDDHGREVTQKWSDRCARCRHRRDDHGRTGCLKESRRRFDRMVPCVCERFYEEGEWRF